MEPTETSTEPTDTTKSPHRKKQAIGAAVVICIIALVVGLTIGLKRRQQLKVACKFSNLESDLKFCMENRNFANDETVLSTIPSEIGLLTQMTVFVWGYGEAYSIDSKFEAIDGHNSIDAGKPDTTRILDFTKQRTIGWNHSTLLGESDSACRFKSRRQ